MAKETYDNTNTGAVFRNDYKESAKHPDMTGPLNVEGVEYSIAAWSNTSEKKGKYLKLKITKKDDQPSKKVDQPSAESDSSDLPF